MRQRQTQTVRIAFSISGLILFVNLLVGLTRPAQANVIYQFELASGTPVGFAPQLVVIDGTTSLDFSVTNPFGSLSCFVLGPCIITGAYPGGFVSFTDSSIGSFGNFAIQGTLGDHFIGSIVDNGQNENLDMTCSTGANCNFTLLSERYVCGLSCTGAGEFDRVAVPEPSSIALFLVGLLVAGLASLSRRVSHNRAPKPALLMTPHRSRTVGLRPRFPFLFSTALVALVWLTRRRRNMAGLFSSDQVMR